MNKKLITLLAGVLFCSFIFTSCDDDTEYSEKPVSAELKAVLEQQEGIVFNELGQLEINDAVQNLTSLDLKGAKLTDYSELTILPSLTDLKFTKCDLGTTFDFSVLPAQITGVDLTGTEVSEFSNLIKVEIAENGDETITNLRDLKKLHLPDEAEDNTTDLVRYYRQNKDAITSGAIDMQMADENGNLAKYTTLRSIPDPVFVAYLKKQFGSIFEGDQIDLSKRLSNEEKINAIIMNLWSGVENFDKLANYEGLQYIVHNPYWEGTRITIQNPKSQVFPALKIPATVTDINFEKADFSKGFDLSNATGLISLYLTEVSGIESVDLSASKIWGQRDQKTEESGFGTELYVLGCKEVKSIIFPKADLLRAYKVDIERLPALETCDLTKFSYLHSLYIGDLSDSFKLIYPNITEFPTQPEGIPFPMDRLEFACSPKTYDIPATKEFIKKYKDYNGVRRISKGSLSYDEDKYWR